MDMRINKSEKNFKKMFKGVMLKFACGLMSLCMVSAGIVCFSAGDQGWQAYAASKSKKKIAISAKTVTLKTGGTRTIKIKYAKKKVKWTTSNSKIVKITKKRGKYGRIVTLKAGSKAGKCTITAKTGKKVFKCKVTVKLKERKHGTPDANSDKITDFSIKLLQNSIAADKTEGKVTNILVSPDSVVTALALLENGAEGETLSQLEGLCDGLTIDELNAYLRDMHQRLETPKKPIYTIANSIWYKKMDGFSISENFIDKCKTWHNAAVYGRNFDNDTVSEINGWVDNNTRHMIKKIIDDLEPETRVILINALAFEGAWAEQFTDGQVGKEAFTDGNGAVTRVDMMNGSLSGRGTYLKLKGGKGLVKPYEYGTIAFVGILPPEGVSLDDYINSLTGMDFVEAWRDRQNTHVDIKIPKFQDDYDTSLKAVLQSMGAGRVFTDDAELATMTGTPASILKVDDVLHKTHIEVFENGTKAAAVTAVVAKESAAYPGAETKQVYLNRPFVYALVDTDTGIPLFIGAVRNITK